jgi:DNA modification methylase
MMEYINKVVEGDCLELMKDLPEGCIDMVLCDLPYGTTQNKWDKVIDLGALWKHYERIIKPAGVIALTAQGRFTAQLIESNPRLFKYKLVWIKSKSTNFLNANKQPLRKHEDICIFYNKAPFYNPQKTNGVPYNKGYRKDTPSGTYGQYGGSRALNLDGKRYPCDVLFYEENFVDWVYFNSTKTEGAFHPTQKPVDLGRWLIKTYSRPDSLVLDNACGSGSFLVAAVLEQRNFIGMEKNHQSYHINQRKVDFVKICENRISEARNQISLDL